MPPALATAKLPEKMLATARITLTEVERDEQEGARKPDGHPIVPWYYWEAAGMYRKLKRYHEVRRFARNYDVASGLCQSDIDRRQMPKRLGL